MHHALRLSLVVIQLVGSLLVTAFVALVLLQIAGEIPQLRLKFNTYVVRSGSMEPTIMTGDVVFVRPARSYGLNDIITYHSPEGHLVTHRIIGVKKDDKGQIAIQTKGDNNRTKDSYQIDGNAIIGRRWFVIPKLGYVEVYSRTKLGVIVIVSVIAGWIMADLTWQYLKRSNMAKPLAQSADAAPTRYTPYQTRKVTERS